MRVPRKGLSWRTALAGVALAGAGLVIGCADSTTAPINGATANPDIISIPDDPNLQGKVILCKEIVGGTGTPSFTFNVTINGGTTTQEEITAGTCEEISNALTPTTVVIEEVGETDWDLTNIDVERMRGFVFLDTESEATRTATVFTNNDSGRRVIFTNTFVPPPGDEGCTPGFWKNHLGAWEGYAPTDLVSSVFTDASPFDGNTLLEALNFGGGPGVNGAKMILLRAAVAALLNAASSDVDYTMTTTQVIDAVNAALASGDRETILDLAKDLDADNNLGCPL